MWKIRQEQAEAFGQRAVQKCEDSAVFKGQLRGRDVDLPGVKTRKIEYVKRDRATAEKLRSEFDAHVRSDFVRGMVDDPRKIQALKNAGLTDEDIAGMKSGEVPPGWQVHHKLPLDDNGTNDFDNLVLIKNEPSHKVLTNAQRRLTSGMQDGDRRSLNFPVPDGFVYPPSPGLVRSPP